MKKAVAFILITVMLLTSCARYLKIDFNKYTRVYLPGLSRSGISDSYDLYASEGSRFFAPEAGLIFSIQPPSTYSEG